MSLRDFSRRLGISYDDVALIIQTQFINPNAVLIPRLTRLNVPFTTLKTLHDTLNTQSSIEASFIASLPAGLDATEYGGTSPTDYAAVVAWVTGPAVYPRIMDIITITEQGDTAGDCSGASLLLRYSNPDDTANQLTAADFTRLIRFVRLWQKLAPLLGDSSDTVSIQHTDDILAALYPAAPASAEAGFQALLTRLGFLAAVMGQLSLTGASLGQLLTCWAPIGTGPPAPSTRPCSSPRRSCSRTRAPRRQTVGPVLSDGDVLTTAINSTQVSSYTVVPRDTPAQVAAMITAGDQCGHGPRPGYRPAGGTAGSTRSPRQCDPPIKTGFTCACSPAASIWPPRRLRCSRPQPSPASPNCRRHAGHHNQRRPARLHRPGRRHAAGHRRGHRQALVNATTLQDPFSACR